MNPTEDRECTCPTCEDLLVSELSLQRWMMETAHQRQHGQIIIPQQWQPGRHSRRYAECHRRRGQHHQRHDLVDDRLADVVVDVETGGRGRRHDRDLTLRQRLVRLSVWTARDWRLWISMRRLCLDPQQEGRLWISRCSYIQAGRTRTVRPG